MIARLPVFLTLFLWSSSLAHHHSRDNPNEFSWARERMFAISRAGPIAAYFSGNASEKQYLIETVAHFGEVEERMRQLQATSVDTRRRRSEPCNRVFPQISKAVHAKNLVLGFGKFGSSCITSLSYAYSESLFRTFVGLGAAVHRAGNTAVRTTGIGWPEGFATIRFEYKESIFQCEVMHGVGFRIGGTWAAGVGVTEFPANLRKPDPGRRYMVEYLVPGKRADDPVGNLRFSLPSCDSGVPNRAPRDAVCDTTYKGKRKMMDNATTTLEEWGGVPAGSIFRAIQPLGENPAVRDALTQGVYWRQQAEGSTTGSNIAIMVLSATLALVPISALADVEWTVAAAYAMFTDVLSSTPLLVKGIEILVLSKRTQAAAVSWVYGMETADDIAVVETWSAKCYSRNSLFVTGSLFVAVALSAIVVGIALELFAWNRLQKYKKCYLTMQAGLNAKAARQMWMSGIGCPDCQCYVGVGSGLFPFPKMCVFYEQ